MVSNRKEDLYSYVRKRAIELAQSGDYEDFLTVETVIISEGYKEAQSILKDQKKELNNTCNIAQSSEEKENRRLYKKWINDFVGSNFPSLKQEYPDVKLTIRDSSFSFFNNKNQIDFYKRFSLRKLTGVLYFTGADGSRNKADYHNIVDKNFNEFTIDDLRGLIIIVVSNHF